MFLGAQLKNSKYLLHKSDLLTETPRASLHSFRVRRNFIVLDIDYSTRVIGWEF